MSSPVIDEGKDETDHKVECSTEEEHVTGIVESHFTPYIFGQICFVCFHTLQQITWLNNYKMNIEITFSLPK